MIEIQNMFGTFEFAILEIVSCFEFRASDFKVLG
jgi:hypothetical protein